MYSVILCGGSGTRLWPLSRKNFPKQFLCLYSEKSLLQETFLRMLKIMDAKNIFFITNKENYFNVINQIKDIYENFDKSRIITEPASLNTAPCIALAIKYLKEVIKIRETDPIIFLPSDHFIKNDDDYIKLLRFAFAKVEDNIGTIGIIPTKPETGFGYIHKGDSISTSPIPYFYVSEFKEKPNKKTAIRYVESGEYLWNSGMYIFNVQTFAQELNLYAKDIYNLYKTTYEEFLNKFSQLPEISIDHAISEKSKKVIVFEGDFGWSDIGSFDNLDEISKIKSRSININSENIFIYSTNNRLVTTVGVNDLNIIETKDSILIQKKGMGEDVKRIVNKLKKEKAKEIKSSLIGYRPWGKYEILVNEPKYKVKKITVYPKGKLSLQTHEHRAEHWIVVDGNANIINGDKKIILKENESTFIPVNARHRLENKEEVNLEIIEVQTGNYLEEDDIIRYSDDYGRINKN